jgi:hypothetical protein
MITFPEMLYYMECEGDMPTRTGRINAVIKEIKSTPPHHISEDEFEQVLNNHDLSYEELTYRELLFIIESINK